jgi:hypothetical protein
MKSTGGTYLYDDGDGGMMMKIWCEWRDDGDAVLMTMELRWSAKPTNTLNINRFCLISRTCSDPGRSLVVHASQPAP